MIDINPANKGKFTATKKKTGESTEELTHSKNPLTRKRAIFAQNAKHFHHDKGRKSRAAALSSKIDSLIQFAQDPFQGQKKKKKDSAKVAAAKLSGTLLGGYVGAYGGILRGVETGSLTSGIEGGYKAVGKFKQHAHEDAVREGIKDRERYTLIEGPHGEQQRLLRDRSHDVKPPLMARLKTTGKNIPKAIKEGAMRGRYAIEDAAYKTRKWATRPSLSRSAVIGAGIGAVVGRHVLGKLAKRQEEEKKATYFSSAPPIDSYNPITRYKQHKALDEWVKNRPPSAGISAEDLYPKYPENKEETAAIAKGRKIGAGIGAAAGLTAGVARGITHGKGAGFLTGAIATPLASGLGSGIGEVIGGHKYLKKRIESHEKSHAYLVKHLTNPKEARPLKSFKGSVPTATSYREVADELKKQNVGFVPRHAIATISRPPIWAENNAMFVDRGDKGLVIATKNVHPAVFRHEAGHAKDYEYYGGHHGFRKAYPHYGNPILKREDVIANTMLPEHRAWAYANAKSKGDKRLQKEALNTYRQGMGLSSVLDEILYFDAKTGVKAVLEDLARRNKSGGAGLVVKRRRMIYPKSVHNYDPTIPYNEAEERLAKKMHPARLSPLQFSRGDMLRKAIPDYPEAIGGGFKKGGYIQKEAANALRKIRKPAEQGASNFLTITRSLSSNVDVILFGKKPRYDLAIDGGPNGLDKNGCWKHPAIKALSPLEWHGVRRRINHPEEKGNYESIDREAKANHWNDKQKLAVAAADNIHDQTQERLAKWKSQQKKKGPSRGSKDSIVNLFGDPRPRNQMGEFTQSNNDVPDPNTMAKTYRSTLANSAIAGAGGGFGAALTGGAVKSLFDKIKSKRK